MTYIESSLHYMYMIFLQINYRHPLIIIFPWPTITRQYNNLPQTLARTPFSARTPYHAIPALWNNFAIVHTNNRIENRLQEKITQQIMTRYKSEVTCNNPRCPDCRTSTTIASPIGALIIYRAPIINNSTNILDLA